MKCKSYLLLGGERWQVPHVHMPRLQHTAGSHQTVFRPHHRGADQVAATASAAAGHDQEAGEAKATAGERLEECQSNIQCGNLHDTIR